jgi:hypothetical protein
VRAPEVETAGGHRGFQFGAGVGGGDRRRPRRAAIWWSCSQGEAMAAISSGWCPHPALQRVGAYRLDSRRSSSASAFLEHRGPTAGRERRTAASAPAERHRSGEGALIR